MGHGGMNYHLKAVRLILIFVNVISFLIGATLIGQSIEILVTRRFESLTEFIPKIENVITTKNKVISDEILCLIMIIPGFIFLSLGFFGCSSVITQIPCLLYCFSSIIGIVLFFQTMIIVLFISYRSTLKQQLVSTIRRSIREVYHGPFEENLRSISLLWDWIMYHFKCCGIESKHDFDIATKWNRTNPWWKNSMPIENQNFQYPFTCCAMTHSFNTDSIIFNRILSCAINGSDIYEVSCYQKVFDAIHSIQDIIVIIVIFLVLIELLSLMFVLILLNRHQIERISNIMERSPPSYSVRTRFNNANLYYQI